MLSSGVLVRAALVAAAVTGLVLGAFHLTVSEPFVDRAITLEAARSERNLALTGGTEEQYEELFSRRTQKVGLLAGTLIFSLAVGCIFAGAFALLAGRLPGETRRAQVAMLAAAAFVTTVLLPFLKYPANPPGVGDPGTLASRQLLYLACILLTVAGLGVAVRVFGRLRARASTRLAVAGSGLVLAVWLTALLVLLPSRTDPVNTPARLLWEFRAASLAGQIIFWVLFSGLFGTLLARGEQTPAVASARLS